MKKKDQIQKIKEDEEDLFKAVSNLNKKVESFSKEINNGRKRRPKK